MTFELSGFQTTVLRDIRVQAGATFSLDAQLGVAAVQETVTVSGAAPIIDYGRHQRQLHLHEGADEHHSQRA